MYHPTICPTLFWQRKSVFPSRLKSATVLCTLTLNATWLTEFPLESVAVMVT